MSLTEFLANPTSYAERYVLAFNETSELFTGKRSIAMDDEGQAIKDDEGNLVVRVEKVGISPSDLATGNHRRLRASDYRLYFDVAAIGNVRSFSFYEGRTASTGPARAYYLPYRQNAAVSMTLGNRCDYFFTSSLSGCTVQVFGPARTPTITHANAGDRFNTLFSQEKARLETGGLDAEEAGLQANRRVNAQVDNVINTMLPDPGGAATATLRKSDYLQLAESRGHQRRAKRRFLQDHAGEGPGKFRLFDYDLDLAQGRPTLGAAVFGLRNHNGVRGWSIFYQASVGIVPEYRRTKGTIFKKTLTQTGIRDEAVVGGVQQLFP